jgi:hypothetical protein
MLKAMEPDILASWKEIARHLGKSVRTVQRWELVSGLPIRRPKAKRGSVLIYRTELDVWLAEKFTLQLHPETKELRAALKRNVRKSRELQSANRKLVGQLSQSSRLFSEECRRLAIRSLKHPTIPILSR